LPERQARDFTAASRAHDADGLRRDGARAKPRLQAEIDQYPAGIRRELQARTGFLEPLALLENDDAKALSGKPERRRQAADPGAGHDDGS
jgi:hypothetical protein